MTDVTDVSAVLDLVARFGPFFTVRTGRAQAADPTWRPWCDLWDEPAPLADRIGHVRRALGCDTRVAASIAFQGLAASAVSAPFAAAVAHGVVPLFGPESLHWRPSASGPWALWCPDPAGAAVAAAAGAARTLAEVVVTPLLEPLVAAVRTHAPVSPRVLRGNAASAVASAKRLVVAARPDLAGPAAATAALLLGRGPLDGAGRLLRPAGPDRVWSFRRRSCCLYYRAPGGGLCEDCVLHDRAP